MAIHRGSFSGKKKRFGIVVARFNEFITGRLLQSAVETLQQSGVRSRDVEVVWVPGALEVPYFCRKLSKAKKFDAIIALACILRGGTFHFECVSDEITRGVSQVALEFGIPIATGIITADTLEQAIDRAGLKAGNKGAQAALAALEIASLDQALSPKAGRRKTHA
ncbi:MAG: 6,7-dimethyl-8-ribityllumazine synthase [Candidatus Omnitrophica bacterium]|nr:6,7-dimethyl-8-ribityllumazine synthase [Candidatus Omnitrophota bacterium]